MQAIYLDWAAGAKILPVALEKYQEVSQNFYGNPSSPHPEGMKAKELLEECRTECASCLSVAPEKIIFTASASESNNLLLFSMLRKQRAGSIVMTPLAHKSVSKPVKIITEEFGLQSKLLKTDSNGRIDFASVDKAVDRDTALISIPLTHNESGVIQPLAELVEYIRKRQKALSAPPVHIHIDAAQSLGKTTCSIRNIDIDSAAFSGHKIGAGRGCGILYLARSRKLLNGGGGQEFGMRSGTENLPAIASFTAALKETTQLNDNRLIQARVYEQKILALVKQLAGKIVPADREQNRSLFTPYIISAAFPPLPGEVVARMLGEKGCTVGIGSACANNSAVNRSRRFREPAMATELTASVIRISTGFATTNQEISIFSRILTDTINRLRDELGIK